MKRAKSEYPSRRWDPYTGDSAVFTRAEDVPEGWIDRHPSSMPKPEPKAKVEVPPEKAPLTRDEVKTALEMGGITFPQNAATAALTKTLDEAVTAAYAARGLAEVEGETLRERLARLAAPAAA